jgi:hypothetical protein
MNQRKPRIQKPRAKKPTAAELAAARRAARIAETAERTRRRQAPR